MVDTLELRSYEGRTSLRKATGSWQEAIIRGLPNQETVQTGMFGILQWINSCKKRYVVKWNISVTTGKENNSDSLSSGERNGNRSN